MISKIICNELVDRFPCIGISFLFVEQQCNKKMRDKKMKKSLTRIRILAIFGLIIFIHIIKFEVLMEGMKGCSNAALSFFTNTCAILIFCIHLDIGHSIWF
jgi:hypothetical protein